VRINEWLADPTEGPDWFELFNPELLPVSIGGLSFSDDLQDPTNSRVPPLSFLDGWSWRQFFADNQAGVGADHVNFKLSASGEAIGLFDTNGATIDAVTFGAQVKGVPRGGYPMAATRSSPPYGRRQPSQRRYRWRPNSTTGKPPMASTHGRATMPRRMVTAMDRTILRNFFAGTDPQMATTTYGSSE
jgi:hypothetical protein